MDIKAFKMDGLGNDFVIIDNREKITNLSKDQVIKICNRNFIGCDQLILIEKDNTTDASLKFFNSDGGESGACGNGTRCVADLISKEKNNKNVTLTTQSGILKSEILGNNLVITEIGKAKINWNEIPLSKESVFCWNSGLGSLVVLRNYQLASMARANCEWVRDYRQPPGGME